MAPSGIVKVKVDVEEFVRTRDALAASYMSLSLNLDRTIKAYLAHTEAFLGGEIPTVDLNVLAQGLNTAAATAAAALPKLEAPIVEEDGKVTKKRAKRAYKTRDPNAPKRPLTAYFRYLNEQRPLLQIELSSRGGQQKAGELSSIATERWRALTEAQQLPYRTAYVNEMAVYNQESADYKARTGQLVQDDEDEDDESAEPEPVQPTTPAKASKAKSTVTPAKPVVQEEQDDDDDDDDDTSDSDTDTDSEDEAPPPPKAKKSSPVKKPAVEKTPKSSLKKDKATASAAPTPMFNSINNDPPASSANNKKKRKSEAVDESEAKKTKSEEASKKDKKEKAKKKRASTVGEDS